MSKKLDSLSSDQNKDLISCQKRQHRIEESYLTAVLQYRQLFIHYMHFSWTYNAAQNHSSVLTCPTKATNCLPEIWLPRVLFVSYYHWVTYCVLLEDLLRSKYTSPVNHLVNMKIQSKRNKNLQAIKDLPPTKGIEWYFDIGIVVPIPVEIAGHS